MDADIAEILAQVRALERDLEHKLEARRGELAFTLHRKKVIFEEEMRARHRALRTGLATYLRRTTLVGLATAVVTYAIVVPLVLLDLSVTLFQWVCFPAWGIARVKRADHVVIDRQYLAYLNGIEKMHCVYCGYANGVIAYAREVASRTEQYWCPIKHARPGPPQHDRAREFLDYGDAEGWRETLEELRLRLK
jgi:hypothetical protein